MPSQSRMEMLADRLAQARREARQIEALPGELVPRTVDEAYAINGLVAKRLGWEPLGWKIAGTTADVRKKLSLDAPIYGHTFRRCACQSPARLRRDELLDPLVECEFFVTLAKDLGAREKPWSMADIVDAIGTIHAGIEVAECRFPSAALPPLPAVLADGSASGRYVFGSAMPHWREGLAAVPVTLEVDGAIRRRGTGADVMGDPLQPLLWLAEERRRWGDGLRGGETVSTGSMTGMLPIRTGQKVRALFGASASVEIAFD